MLQHGKFDPTLGLEGEGYELAHRPARGGPDRTSRGSCPCSASTGPARNAFSPELVEIYARGLVRARPRRPVLPPHRRSSRSVGPPLSCTTRVRRWPIFWFGTASDPRSFSRRARHCRAAGHAIAGGCSSRPPRTNVRRGWEIRSAVEVVSLPASLRCSNFRYLLVERAPSAAAAGRTPSREGDVVRAVDNGPRRRSRGAGGRPRALPGSAPSVALLGQAPRRRTRRARSSSSN